MQNEAYVQVKSQKTKLKAAILIQRNVRSYLWRKREIAATVIQRKWRSHHRKIVAKSWQPEKILDGSKVLKNLDTIHSAVLLFGGFNPNELYSSENNARNIYLYTLESEEWQFVGDTPEPKSHFGIAKIGGFVYIFGIPNTLTSNKRTSPLNIMLCVIGGSDPRKKNGKGRSLPTSSTYKLNLRDGKWTILSPMGIARNNFGYTAVGNHIYVFGGNDATGRLILMITIRTIYEMESGAGMSQYNVIYFITVHCPHVRNTTSLRTSGPG